MPIRKPGIRPDAPGTQSLADGLAEAGVYAPSPHGRSILVNIPSAELVAFENGLPVFVSRTVVGAARTPTPIGPFTGGVVRFRPSWTPTPRMIRAGLYTPGTRPPGPRNPLGLAALRFAEGGLVYLHGTNAPAAFERQARHLSSGCVRVSRIDILVGWALGWSDAEVQRAMHGRRTFDTPTPPIPIALAYHTRFPTPDGRVRSWPDVYGRKGRRSA